MRLHELTEQYEVLLDMMYDPEVDEQTVRDTMEAIWGEIEDKADGYAKIIFSMKADIEVLKAEEERLSARRKHLDERARWLKENLMANMQAIGKEKFKTALFSFSIQKNGGKEPLVIDGNIQDIPGKFLIPQEPLVNNDAVRKLLAEKQVEWAHLEPRGVHLGIR